MDSTVRDLYFGRLTDILLAIRVISSIMEQVS